MAVVVSKFTPIPRHGFRVGVPAAGWWHELLNSDAGPYGGSGQGNFGGVPSAPVAWHGHPQSLVVTLPPLAIVVLEAPGSARASRREP